MKTLLLALLLTLPAMAKQWGDEEFKSLQVLAKQEGWTFELKNYDKKFETGLKKKILPKAKWVKPKKEWLKRAAVPDKLDLRPLTQIENQGSLGSCWAFSLVANLRDGLFLLGKDPGRLSQEYLTQCSGYCHGGYFDAADYFIKPKGCPLWDEVPYTASCSPRCKEGTPVAHIKEWYFLGKSQRPTTEDLVLYLATYKLPLSVTVSASGSWSSYGSGVFNACNSSGTNHMINIVGYDLEGQVFDDDGELPAGKGIWILRNSWGASWGEDGWMRSKITGTSGRKCNSVGDRAVAYDFGDLPPDPECGNGKVEPGEECDDGNLDPGDGCDEQCMLEPECGNGKIEPEVGEECDPPDGKTCDEECRIIPQPPPEPSIWERIWQFIVMILDWLWPFN